MKMFAAIVSAFLILAIIWFGLIGISRLESHGPCRDHGDAMLRILGFKP